jgi:transcriptional regulator with XRE-family HTH domain
LAIGLPASRLAAELGIFPPRWSQWENGRHLADLRAMVRLCRRYGVTLDYLYRGEESGLPKKLFDAIRDAGHGRSIPNTKP